MNTLWYYRYAVEYYDNSQRRYSTGIVAAHDYEEVIEQLNAFYGKDNIGQFWVQILTDYVLNVKDDLALDDVSFRDYVQQLDELQYEAN